MSEMKTGIFRSILKYALVSMFLLSIPFACAFRWGNIGEKGALLYFSSEPMQKENVRNVGRFFPAQTRVYYLLLNPKGFRDDYIRVQIVKKEEKTNHWGYKIYWSKDYHIDSSQNEFMSYFVIDEPGYYFMQIFSFDDFDRVIARNDFWIKR